MKKVFFPLTIFSILLLLIGCKDNSMTDPVSSQPLNKADLNRSNIKQGIISLDYKLVDPNNRDINYKLSGSIDYTEEFLKPQPSETISAYDMKLSNEVIATLTKIVSSDPVINTWKISSESDDLVSAASGESVVLVKSYPVIGNADKMDLVCTFIVTPNGVKLNSVALETPEVRNGA